MSDVFRMEFSVPRGLLFSRRLDSPSRTAGLYLCNYS